MEEERNEPRVDLERFGIFKHPKRDTWRVAVRGLHDKIFVATLFANDTSSVAVWAEPDFITMSQNWSTTAIMASSDSHRSKIIYRALAAFKSAQIELNESLPWWLNEATKRPHVIFGFPGIGKTTLALTHPGFLDFDTDWIQDELNTDTLEPQMKHQLAGVICRALKAGHSVLVNDPDLMRYLVYEGAQDFEMYLPSPRAQRRETRWPPETVAVMIDKWMSIAVRHRVPVYIVDYISDDIGYIRWRETAGARTSTAVKLKLLQAAASKLNCSESQKRLKEMVYLEVE